MNICMCACTYIYIRTCTIRVYTNINTCAYTLTVYNNLELRTTNLSMVDEVDSKPDVSFLQNVLPRQEDEGLDHEGEVPQEWGLNVSEYRDLPGRTMMCYVTKNCTCTGTMYVVDRACYSTHIRQCTTYPSQ